MFIFQLTSINGLTKLKEVMTRYGRMRNSLQAVKEGVLSRLFLVVKSYVEAGLTPTDTMGARVHGYKIFRCCIMHRCPCTSRLN